MMVVRQPSFTKMKFALKPLPQPTLINNPPPTISNNGSNHHHQHQHHRAHKVMSSDVSRLQKQDSDLNLLPTDSQKNWAIVSDEVIGIGNGNQWSVEDEESEQWWAAIRNRGKEWQAHNKEGKEIVDGSEVVAIWSLFVFPSKIPSSCPCPWWIILCLLFPFAVDFWTWKAHGSPAGKQQSGTAIPTRAHWCGFPECTLRKGKLIKLLREIEN